MKTKNCFKKYISLLLAILMLVSCLTQGLVSFAIEIPDGYILQDGIFPDGETVTVTAEIITGKTTLFEFIPTVTGVYQFEADPDLMYGYDTYGYLFDADLNELTSDDDSGSGYNFLISYELIAGNTYYFGAKFVDSNQSGMVDVTLNFIESQCYHSTIISYPEVQATCTENGYTAGDKCTTCGAWISGHEVIYAHHSDENSDDYCDVCSEFFWEYEIVDGNVTIISYKGDAKDIVIPDAFDGYTVTIIGENAFSDCTSLQSVTIPDGITSIGWRAFFSCDSLQSIEVSGNNLYYSSDSYGVLFNKDKTELIQYPVGNSRTSYSIPDSAISIGDAAFSGCNSLISVTIPDSVTSIGDYAFGWCKSLQSITIPNGVKSIQWGAFQDCTSLQSIIIPDGVKSIGVWAFDGCYSLQSITLPDSVTSIGWGAFGGTAYYNDATNWVDDVLYIGNHLIKAKTSVSGAYIIKSDTKTIGGSAFEGCYSLQSIIIPDGVKSIGVWAFSGCYSLQNITLPDSVTSIGDEAFGFCTSLQSVTIPDSVTSIGRYVFDYSGVSTIKGYKGSYAETYALENGFEFVALTKIPSNYTGLYKVDGVWRYVKNGELDNTYTGLCKYNAKWYYVKKGVVDFNYTGLCKYSGKWYYVKDGIVDKSYTGLAKRSGKWYHISKGVVDFDYTGLSKYNNKWYYVEDGKLDKTYTGLCKYNNKWYFVEDGVVDKSYTGLCKYNSKWYYVKKGVVDFTYTGLCKRNGKWYYVDDGKVNFKYTGLCKYNKKWYYVDDGVVNFKYTGNVKYNGKKYKVVKGVKV